MENSTNHQLESLPIQKARSDIDRLEVIVLSNRERDLFLSALENATPSTGELQQAFSRFRQKYYRS
jgi:uncharacterized protein (DUF1778 family)